MNTINSVNDSRVVAVTCADHVAGDTGYVTFHKASAFEEQLIPLSLLAEAESRIVNLENSVAAMRRTRDEMQSNLIALQSRLELVQAKLDAVVRLADRWEKLAETHGVRMFSGNDHWLFANELRKALVGESPGNEEETK